MVDNTSSDHFILTVQQANRLESTKNYQIIFYKSYCDPGDDLVGLQITLIHCLVHLKQFSQYSMFGRGRNEWIRKKATCFYKQEPRIQ